MKKYIKPIIMFEDFEADTMIAACTTDAMLDGFSLYLAGLGLTLEQVINSGDYADLYNQFLATVGPDDANSDVCYFTHASANVTS